MGGSGGDGEDGGGGAAMSLINQMLQDLDKRRAAHGVGTSLPNDVRPLPQMNASRRPVVLGGLVLVALLAGFAFYQFGGSIGASLPPPITEPAANPAAVANVAVPEASPAPEAVAVELAPDASPLQALEGSLRLADALGLPMEQQAEMKVELRSEAKPKAPVMLATPKVEAKEPGLGIDPLVMAESSVKPEVAAKASGKQAKSGAIERSDIAVSPRERAESEYRKAISAVNQGRIDEAVDGLRNALRQDVLHSASRQLLVKLLLEAKRTDEAIQELQDGLHAQPAQLNWAMSLARLQVSRGDLNGALKTLEFSMPAAGNNADYQGFAGHVLHRLGRDKESARHYQSAARLSPGDGRWWLGLGLAFDAEGRSAEAREAFLQARQCGNLGPELMAMVEQKLR